jgi:hypothetical protein
MGSANQIARITNIATMVSATVRLVTIHIGIMGGGFGGCEECTGAGECPGEIIILSEGWSGWYVVNQRECGWCKNPVKTVPIGYRYTCTPNWNITKILWCGALIPGCIYICTHSPWQVCLGCIAGLGLCGEGGLCSFVEACELDPKSGSELTGPRPDWDGDLGAICCHY